MRAALGTLAIGSLEGLNNIKVDIDILDIYRATEFIVSIMSTKKKFKENIISYGKIFRGYIIEVNRLNYLE